MNGPTPPEGPFPEGPACRVRRTPIDYPSILTGHDKRAPPTFFRRHLLVRSISPEGPACQVRLSTSDHGFRFSGDWSPALKAGLKPRTPYGVRRFIAAFWVKALAFTTVLSARLARQWPVGGTRSSNPHNGGTCLSGPVFQDEWSVSFHRARQACPSEGRCPLSEHDKGSPVRAIHELPLPGLVTSRAHVTPGTTSVPRGPCPRALRGPWPGSERWGCTTTGTRVNFIVKVARAAVSVRRLCFVGD